jgi:hypothetical protein
VHAIRPVDSSVTSFDFINEVLSKQDKLLMVLPRLVKKVIGK